MTTEVIPEEPKADVPAPPLSAKPAAAKPTAVHSATSAAKSTVTVTLDPHVHEHFAAKAEEEERSLAKYLQRLLRELVNREKTAGAQTGSKV